MHSRLSNASFVQVSERISYDSSAGIFTWKSLPRGKGYHQSLVGKEAGKITNNGYRLIGIDGKAHCAHRLAFLLMNGFYPLGEVDHINGQKDDNRWVNLREVSRHQNAHNRTKTSRNSTGFKGVSFDRARNQYSAKICAFGTKYDLGRHPSAELAYQAYCAASTRLHKECARLR